jgi:osmotically inducible protein OsmC
MKLIKRKSSARWCYKANGKPEILMDDRTLLKHATYSCRLPIPDRIATSAAELIAAAHALCFSMALTKQLSDVKTNRGRVHTTATVTLENWISGWTVTNIHLDISARLPQITQCDFIDATVRAKTSCFVSRIMKPNISMTAKLQR